MKRVLISAAAAASCVIPSLGSAASVTLYGVADIGIFSERSKVNGVRQDSAHGLVSGGQSGSRWGLRGSE